MYYLRISYYEIIAILLFLNQNLRKYVYNFSKLKKY